MPRKFTSYFEMSVIFDKEWPPTNKKSQENFFNYMYSLGTETEFFKAFRTV